MGVELYRSAHSTARYAVEAELVAGRLHLREVGVAADWLDEGRVLCTGEYVIGHDETTGGLLAWYFHPPGTCWDSTLTAVATFERDGGADSGEDTAGGG